MCERKGERERDGVDERGEGERERGGLSVKELQTRRELIVRERKQLVVFSLSFFFSSR